MLASNRRSLVTPTLVLALLSLAGAHAPAHAERAYVAGSDFGSGELSGIDVPTRVPACDVAPLSGDPRIRAFDGKIYVVNRGGPSNIQVHDGTTYGFVRQFSVGAGSNPYDIAFASATHAYVTRYESADLWVVNPATGTHTGTISLAAFADADGIPEMDHLQCVGPLLFVSLQRLDRNHSYALTAYSSVAVIDMRTDTVVDCDPVAPGVQPIVLARKNPVTAFAFDVPRSRLYLGCAGNYGVADGAIEAIDAAGLTALGVVAPEDSLGGDVLDLAWRDDARAFAIVSDAGFNSALVRWSPVRGRAEQTLYAPGGFTLSDAEVTPDGTQVWVGHSDFADPGVLVFDAGSGAAVGAPILCTLPPQGLAFDAGEVVAVGLNPPPRGLALAPPSPNPARAPVRLTFAAPGGGAIKIEVLDVTGRRVWEQRASAATAGEQTLVWDLFDASGARVPPGLYRVRARSAGASTSRSLIVLP
ncbi:MAG: FlgD immunoglobulin-like domain containing protein [Candidatus Eisenbacteria bacterium]